MQTSVKDNHYPFGLESAAMSQVRPIHYHLRIEPDFSPFTFEGAVRIHLEGGPEVQQIVLNARELAFRSVTVRQDGLGVRDCQFQMREERQEAIIWLPESMSGAFELAISYTGVINDGYAGLYRSRYRHDGREKIMVSTQFEASDARRAFPCFDRPDMKATFDIELIIAHELTGISNEAVLEEKDLARGKKLVRFRRTPRMSTYLTFFAAGEFEFLEDASDRPLVRVATAPGKRAFGRYALDMARKSLTFGQDYLDTPYPLSKCDYIAMPDSMGAMENFGAIRHAEDVLLVYPGVTPQARQTLIAKIVAHESIHLWFGDLVSPAAWKYLWLNEAFATYFTYVIPHHYHPEWGVWEQFFHERLLSGLERDALAGSVAIDLPNADDPNADPAPTPSTAPIVYNKGAAVIRMLAAYLGEEAFRQALHDFLAQYQFESATSEQFWAAMERSSGVPLERFAHAWIQQPGHPLITVERAGRGLRLRQQRFSYADAASPGVWVIPVDLALFLEDGAVETRQILLSSASHAIDLPENIRAYKLNAGFTGFYRVQYPDGDWQRLGERIKSRALSAADSLNALDDLFAQVKAGRRSVQAYLHFIADYCAEEDRYLPLTNLAKNLGRLHQVSPGHRPQIAALGISIFERALDRMSWQPQADEPLIITELRETLLWASHLLGSTRVARFIRPQFQRYLQGRPPHRDIIAPVLKIGAGLDADGVSHLWAIAAAPERPEAERIMALEALGNHPHEQALTALLEKNLTEIPNSLQSYMILACAHSPSGPTFIWPWFRQHLPQLAARLPLVAVERLIVEIAPLARPEQRADVEQRLGDFATRHPGAEDSVGMALELMAVNQRLGGFWQ